MGAIQELNLLYNENSGILKIKKSFGMLSQRKLKKSNIN